MPHLLLGQGEDGGLIHAGADAEVQSDLASSSSDEEGEPERSAGAA